MAHTLASRLQTCTVGARENRCIRWHADVRDILSLRSQGHTELVAYLIHWGASLTKPDGNKMAPLACAQRSQAEAKPADKHKWDETIKCAPAQFTTASHYFSSSLSPHPEGIAPRSAARRPHLTILESHRIAAGSSRTRSTGRSTSRSSFPASTRWTCAPASPRPGRPGCPAFLPSRTAPGLGAQRA